MPGVGEVRERLREPRTQYFTMLLLVRGGQQPWPVSSGHPASQPARPPLTSRIVPLLSPLSSGPGLAHKYLALFNYSKHECFCQENIFYLSSSLSQLVCADAVQIIRELNRLKGDNIAVLQPAAIELILWEWRYQCFIHCTDSIYCFVLASAEIWNITGHNFSPTNNFGFHYNSS